MRFCGQQSLHNRWRTKNAIHTNKQRHLHHTLITMCFVTLVVTPFFFTYPGQKQYTFISSRSMQEMKAILKSVYNSCHFASLCLFCKTQQFLYSECELMGLSVSLTCLCLCKFIKLYIASPLLWLHIIFQSALYTNKEMAKLCAFLFIYFASL